MRVIIGVMGPGENATPEDLRNAYELGQLIARSNLTLLTGGRPVGVMDAASRGAKQAGGLIIGILPSGNKNSVSDAVDIAIVTDLGQARNNINVLSSDVVIACGMGLGTVSEVALALKSGKYVILLNNDPKSYEFFYRFSPDRVFRTNTPQETIQLTHDILARLSLFETK
ncbi:TIGR00725 family protein [Aphanothece hegewaldii CCALA 016]|uniref:TIGR00725 family protein n=1 Tax=Aphanothece hegewaldii CCALA 016 TaxID=2107694 RepID=A0A2T1LQZ3_9CHRO|nr:TIGR00725 family protein [Aphanothece hegewaldii]PSF29360.1 TIGR00725 family protein [Aphanothece hegewaldii CCALA 016]